MPLLRIVKRYNHLTAMRGIIEVDKVPFERREDAATWVEAVNKARGVDFDIIEAEWVLVDGGSGAEIIDNPTGGFIGVLPRRA